MRFRRSRERGSLLLEALVAIGILATGIVALTQLLAVSLEMAARSRARTLGMLLASQKIEQLLALDWTIGEDGSRTSDPSSDLSVEPQGAGGSGLSAGSDATLFSTTTRFSDYLDAAGHWIAAGPTQPPDARFVRRWAILPLESDPGDTRVFIVVVTTLAAERGSGVTRVPRVRNPAECWAVAIRPRSEKG